MSPLLSPEARAPPPPPLEEERLVEVGGPGPEAPPPSVLQNGWAFKRERLSCVWSGAQQGGDDFGKPDGA